MHNNQQTPLAIKVCGMRQAENVKQVAGLKPDYMGFIFWKGSKRYAGNLSPDVVNGLPADIKRVGVFVNQSVEEVVSTAGAYGITHVQLHGDESPQCCKELQMRGLKVCKAVAIESADDLKGLEQYVQVVDMFVFDTKSGDSRGGTGRMFDHSVLESYTLGVPFLLSGGISPESADSIKKYALPSMIGVDVNSRFELEPGLKDLELLKIFINTLRMKL